MPEHDGRNGLKDSLRVIGPGLLIAATGVGAGDLVAAAISGERYGFAVVWVAVVGAALKFALNEGLARWQLATGTTLLEGWARHLGRGVQYLFTAYLIVWSFIVAGALISACGLAAHSLMPWLSVEVWGIVHSIVAAVLVVVGGYKAFEKLVGVMVALMFITLVGSALLTASPLDNLIVSIRSASIPPGSGKYILGVMGGVGGSVTLLFYGYWIREKGWNGPERMRTVRLDLGVAYLLTGLFGVAVIVLAAHVLHGTGVEVEDTGGVLEMASMLGRMIGPVGRWIFLVGFWGAVATSMLGVWQGVPYLFCNFVGLMKGLKGEKMRAIVGSRSAWYRGFLTWLCLPPISLLLLGRPVRLIVWYAVLSAFLMPFLAGTLLYMNSSTRLVGRRFRSGWLSNGMLLLCLILFGYLAYRKIFDTLT